MQPEIDDSADATSLKALVTSLVARLGALIEQGKAKDARIDALLAEIAKLTARIGELEAKLGTPPKTPTNSSLPPSSGQKVNAAPAGSEQKKKRQGRPGVARELCPSPDVTRDVRPERCRCGAALSGDDLVLAHAYDHIDIPPIKPVTTRINLWGEDCPCCRRRVTAEPPADMPPGSPFGPGITSIIAYLHGCQMVSYKRLVEVAHDRRLSPDAGVSVPHHGSVSR